MMPSYVGYHGTTKESSKKIMKSKNFLKSRGEDEWLGPGVYFFEDEEDSHWWCKVRKKLISYSLIRVYLTPNIVINFVSSKRDVENFKRFCSMVKSRSSKKSDGIKRDNYMSLAIKLMLKYEEHRPDMIIGGFDRNRSMIWFEKLELKKKFPLEFCQVQYCVLNDKCISEIDIFKEVG